MRRFVAICLMVSLTACTSWRVQELAPADVIKEQRPASIRVTLADRSRLYLTRPQVRGDTLVGFRGRDTTRVPLVAVSGVAVRKVDATKTALLILGLGAVSLVVVVGAIILVARDVGY